MQSYSDAGDFSSLGKLRSAIYSNAMYYGIYLAVFFMLLIYAAVKGMVLNALVFLFFNYKFFDGYFYWNLLFKHLVPFHLLCFFLQIYLKIFLYVNRRIRVEEARSIFREYLKVILISASNTWGLFLLVVLLGYGLIEVPRQFWQMGNRGIFRHVFFLLLCNYFSL